MEAMLTSARIYSAPPCGRAQFQGGLFLRARVCCMHCNLTYGRCVNFQLASSYRRRHRSTVAQAQCRQNGTLQTAAMMPEPAGKLRGEAGRASRSGGVSEAWPRVPYSSGSLLGTCEETRGVSEDSKPRGALNSWTLARNAH